MFSQKTRHQKLNSYWVMNSLGDNLSTQQRYPSMQRYTHAHFASQYVWCGGIQGY